MAAVTKPQTWWLKTHILFYHSSKGQKSKVCFTGSKSKCSQDHAPFNISRV